MARNRFVSAGFGWDMRSKRKIKEKCSLDGFYDGLEILAIVNCQYIIAYIRAKINFPQFDYTTITNSELCGHMV